MAATHDISNSAVLQEEVRLCREYLWSRYGNRNDYPPFDPTAVREICQQSGAMTIFDTIVNAMSCEGHSSKKKRQMKIKLFLSFIFSCLDNHKR